MKILTSKTPSGTYVIPIANVENLIKINSHFTTVFITFKLELGKLITYFIVTETEQEAFELAVKVTAFINPNNKSEATSLHLGIVTNIYETITTI